MQLLILRHGIAMDRAHPDCPPDPERALTARGVQRTREAARGLRALGVAPDVIFSSPYRRALETAQIAAEELAVVGPVREVNGLLPHDDPLAFLSDIANLPDRQVLCVGHNPHLNLLISAAAGQPGTFTWLKKAGCACLDMKEGWGTLRWLAQPKTLRQLGRQP